jgi:hypothetical protein
MSKLLRELIQFFELNNQSALEQFINSKKPTNATEVEYWTRKYESESNTTYWGRGL